MCEETLYPTPSLTLSLSVFSSPPLPIDLSLFDTLSVSHGPGFFFTTL